jgi:RimJ/RimL family protein N-acetyltransferase
MFRVLRDEIHCNTRHDTIGSRLIARASSLRALLIHVRAKLLLFSAGTSLAQSCPGRTRVQSPSDPLADPSRYGTVSAIDLSRPPEPPALSGARFAEIGPAEAEALEAAMHASGEYPPGVAAGRFSPDRPAYGIWADGMIVTYGWVAYTAEPLGNSGVSFRIKPGDVYIYDCATRPAYQGRGYYTTLLRGIAADQAQRGVQRAWIATEAGNIASQRGIDRAGFTQVAYVDLANQIDGELQPTLYPAPGAPEELVERARWSYIVHGTPAEAEDA